MRQPLRRRGAPWLLRAWQVHGALLSALIAALLLPATPVRAATASNSHLGKGTSAPAPGKGKTKDKTKEKVGAKDEIPVPADGDRDSVRIRRLQDTLAEILHNRTLARVQVGLRVISARTGRLFYARRPDVLMDPASNQKVLATTAALIRLGADWRYRTELSGPAPDSDGTITGNVYVRGNGDPALHLATLEELAARLRARGVVRINGGVMADPRRIGDDGPAGNEGGAAAAERAPLVVDHGIVLVRVRPGVGAGSPAIVVTDLAQVLAVPGGEDRRHGFIIQNKAVTSQGGRRARVAVRVAEAGGRLRIEVSGRIGVESTGLTFRRRVPHPALHAAVLMRAALLAAGMEVRDAAGTSTRPLTGELVEVHRSAPLAMVLRHINKNSDNEQAERVLQTVGAEAKGGPATTEKGLAVLRDVLQGLGLTANSYLSKNGSGLGHANRITPHAMSDLLRALYLDPRVGPEILQSLSVGGIDGTTRNRFKGTLAARRVRAKTGTLNGKSCLSGLVGDGDDVMVFSMMMQGFRGRALPAVRASQVGAVTAMMRYVREGAGERIDLPQGFDEQMVGRDVETGGEVQESGQDGEGDEPATPLPSSADEIMPLSDSAPAPPPPPPPHRAPGEDNVDNVLRRARLEPPPFGGTPAPRPPAR